MNELKKTLFYKELGINLLDIANITQNNECTNVRIGFNDDHKATFNFPKPTKLI